jgi:hypothetical protein
VLRVVRRSKSSSQVSVQSEGSILPRGFRRSRSLRAADLSVRSIVKSFDTTPVSVIVSGLRSISRNLAVAREKCIVKSSDKNSNLERLFGSSTNLLRGVKELEESPIVDEEKSEVATTLSSIGSERISRSRLMKHIGRVYDLLRSKKTRRSASVDHAKLHAEATALAAAAGDLSEAHTREAPSQAELDLHEMELHLENSGSASSGSRSESSSSSSFSSSSSSSSTEESETEHKLY